MTTNHLPETTTNAPTAAGCARVDTPNQASVTAAIAPALVSSGPSVPSATPVLPVNDIPAYLATRKPVPHYEHETSLFITLPDLLRDELAALFAGFDLVDSYVKAGLSIQKSCQSAFASLSLRGSWKTFRADYDLWTKTRDWVSLVNRAKAGADWQDRDRGLPDLFLEFCANRMGKFARADGKRQALLSIKRQWRTGRNETGEHEPIPGYGNRPVRLNGRMVTGGTWQDWFQAIGYRVLAMPRRPLPLECPAEPNGWSETNIRRQIKARGLFGKAVQALLHEGPCAARSYLPQVHFDRNSGSAAAPGGPMLFLECVEFDDVKCDFLVLDPVSGQVCDLWLLVARDKGTAILLGFGMRPAKTRDDGSQEHLRLRDMKQLCGWILERYGLPPYEVIWKLEHGTATLPPAARLALRELLPGSIDISYNSMIGGPSPTGYAQRAVGNSKAKASLESHNRLQHTMLSHIAGQTGPLYPKRPADLAARAKESAEIFEAAQLLPDHLRRQIGYPVLTLDQARDHLFRCFQLQNERTDHDLQGFDQVVELWDGQRWLPQSLWSLPSPSSLPPRVRKESPLERCARLVAPYRSQWRQISPDIITAFYQHTIREVTVKPNGLITDRGLEFMPPDTQHASRLTPGMRLLAYSHPDDPAFLHLTDGKGRLLGTWLRRSLANNEASLQTAIRYSQSALTAAKEVAASYAADERARLESMRAKNAQLLAANTFVEVAPIHHSSFTLHTSPVASALTSIPRARRQAEDTQATDEALAESLDRL